MNRSFHIVHPSLVLAVALAATCTANAQWTVKSLHPQGALSSAAAGISGSQQVGTVVFQFGSVAALWTGSADSFVNLSPAGAGVESSALGVSNGRQVGHVSVPGVGSHLSSWTGSAQSWIDLESAGESQFRVICMEGYQLGGFVHVYPTSHAAMSSGPLADWVDLHPVDDENAWASFVQSVSGGHQVGYVVRQPSLFAHATLWSGSAESLLDLNPPGAVFSEGRGISGSEQVGLVGFTPWEGHAALWHGSAESCVILGPEADYSVAVAGHDGVQVGEFGGHATVWLGSAASRFDLHTLLPDTFVYSAATGVWADAAHIYVVGVGRTPSQPQHSEAFMWTFFRCASGVDLGRAGGLPGPDGLLDNNDLIVFIDYFFAADAHADRGSAGGVPGADGLFDNNDFVVYIAQFFAGC